MNDRTRHLLRESRADIGLAAAGLAFGWSSLTFPFGRDQGLYYYVAREWVARGAIPYRDVLDHKTPGIYFLHAFSILLFGEHMWSIRILDMACVALMGVLAATFTAERGEPMARGIRGASVLLVSFLFYGFLNFWDTAQSELWYSMLGIASVWAARRIETPARAEVLAGALGSMAMIMKPPAIWFVLIAYGLCVNDAFGDAQRRVERLGLSTLRFGAGFALPLVLTLGYFGAHHALGAMKDIVIGANSYYVSHESSIHDLGDVIGAIADYYRIYNPVDSAMLLGLGVGLYVQQARGAIRERNRYLLAAALCAAGFLAVAMQKKFYLLHWTVVLGPAAVVGANLMMDLRTLALQGPRPRLRGGVLVAMALLLYTGTNGAGTWLYENVAATKWMTGRIDRAAYANTFAVPDLGFWYGHSERVGLWIAAHSNPDDTVAVRGFDPEIYAVADRHYAGRFFWTTFLVSPVRAYRRAEWLAEDDAAFSASRPRFVVTLSDVHDGLDAAETYYARGYVPRIRFDEFTVLERADDPTTTEAKEGSHSSHR